MRVRAALLWISCLTGACSEVTVESGGPLSFALSVDRSTGSVGDSLEFRYEARGTSLNGVILDFADGAVDSVPFFGAQTASGVVGHAFATPGSYRVVGRLEDAVRGATTDSVTVEITAAAAGPAATPTGVP